MSFPPKRRLSLALQGGGAHGAFTWGVLDALLEDGRFEFEAAAGASAGAMNAVVLAQGLMEGGREGARAALSRFWNALAFSQPANLALDSVGGDAGEGLGPLVGTMLKWTRVLTPRELNPLGIDPLAAIVREQIDFEALRRHSRIPLFVAATHVRSGGLRVFREAELSADALLASACLPQLRHGITIDGELYWDGGYAANPPLLPILLQEGVKDLLLVLLLPLERSQAPTTADEIEARVLELGFATPLLAELRTLVQLRARLAGRWWTFDPLVRRLRHLRLHAIDAEPWLGQLPALSRMSARLKFLVRLKDFGRNCAQAWLDRHGEAVGRRSSFDTARLLR